MLQRRLLLLVILATVRTIAYGADVYDEQYRPQFHFSAKKGWLNDPNGLVFFEGQYHLFYQHNPFGESWGNMTWGHATSPDLVHWSERTPALAADPSGVKFSGTAVIDTNNTAGLQTGATPTMSLFYTSVGSFDQRMAYSNDGGRSFRYYEGNPVLPSISGHDDRDPQVFWHEGSNKWIQTVWVAPHNNQPQSFQLYGSSNLKDWSYLSENTGFFECPDFFELPVDGNSNNKQWVMSDASGRYQIGSFDGVSFTPQNPASGMHTQDFGANFYASQSWNNIPADDGRRIQVTWMAGASYPGMPFNQQMGFPAELTLRTTPQGVRMFREPVEEITLLHTNEFSLTDQVVRPGQNPLAGLSGDLFHIKADIELGQASTVGFNVRGHEVRYDVATQTLSALGRSAALAPTSGRIQLEMLVDRASLELFGNAGRVSMTSGFTPAPTSTAINWFSTGGSSRIVSLSAFELESAWPDAQPTPAPGLIGHWRMDDPRLTATFVDDAGNDYGLANSGLISAAVGRAGGAAVLDNPGDYAYIPNTAALNAESFTMSLWMRPRTVGGIKHVIGKSHDQGETWGVEQAADGKLKFSVSTNPATSDQVHTNVPLATGQWNHAVASYNAETGRLEFFLNGKFAGASEGVISGALTFDDNPLMLGRRFLGSLSALDAVDATVDDLQLYGTALTPGQIGYLYQHPGQSIDPTTFEVATLKLQVDPQTGSASIVSTNGTPTAIKGYSILSNAGSLNATGWRSLQDNGQPPYVGWQEANPTGAALSELNPTGSLALNGNTPLQLGNPMTPLGLLEFGTRAINRELSFQYLTSSGQIVTGAVEFVGALVVNNLLLEVDPTTGQTMLTNSSARTVTIRGYSILSASGSLQAGNAHWSSLSDQGVTGVDEANPSSTNLSELAPLAGSGIVLQPGAQFALGSAFKSESAGGAQDLVLEFVYERPQAILGDYNQDGSVDAADYTVWRDLLGSNLALPNEGATPGVVTSDDYQVWKSNFGVKAAVTLEIRKGLVRYGALTAAVASNSVVPEPTTVVITLMLVFVSAPARFWRGLSTPAPIERNRS